MINLEQLALSWLRANPQSLESLDKNLYCQTRDIFQARLDKMTNYLLSKQVTTEDHIYLLAALSGEIGNNSFDHNLGSWPDVPGIFFGYDVSDNKTIVLADRGRGILTTLRRAKPSLQDDSQALETAFREKISGRAPENRGNGLKFVRQTIHDQKLHLTFLSGLAQAKLNKNFSVEKNSQNIQGCLAILNF